PFDVTRLDNSCDAKVYLGKVINTDVRVLVFCRFLRWSIFRFSLHGFLICFNHGVYLFGVNPGDHMLIVMDTMPYRKIVIKRLPVERLNTEENFHLSCELG